MSFLDWTKRFENFGILEDFKIKEKFKPALQFDDEEEEEESEEEEEIEAPRQRPRVIEIPREENESNSICLIL